MGEPPEVIDALMEESSLGTRGRGCCVTRSPRPRLMRFSGGCGASCNAGGGQRLVIRAVDGWGSVTEPRERVLRLQRGKETTHGGEQLMAPRGCLWPRAITPPAARLPPRSPLH